MGNRVWRTLAFALLAPALLLFAGNIQAASLEKIEVASRLGEPFYAEVPLKLEANELVSKVFVEIAASSDYKIFEVYRDPILKSIRADVASDKRGVRVELTSRSRIKSPFFNLVLKIRYGRVSHFKKFPVFLDAAKSIQQAATMAPQPTVEAIKQPASQVPVQTSLTKSAGQAFMPEPSTTDAASVKPEPKYYEGWARTDRYGPIVRGDTLSTVAERLRIDYRYTRNQIMQALFEKNLSSFDQENINLMKAGSHLNVPIAAEIEKHNKAESTHFLAEQEKNWKKLTQQPRYAAEKEAQRTRYTKRISVGEHADGVASAPEAITNVADKISAAQSSPQAQPQTATAVSEEKSASPPSATASQSAEIAAAVAQSQAESGQALDDLRQQNTLLQKQLSSNQKNIETLNRKVENDAVTAAATQAHLEKLEILISRLQSELEKVDQQKSAPLAAGMDWVMWLLIALVIILLGIVAMLMRREPAHPGVAVAPASPDTSAEMESAEQGKALESVIEHEVAGIETAESEVPSFKETATIDSLPVFTDELSDTDTAELEPFDSDVNTEPDPDINYMAEADVYIRYGMDDEAIKQLDMALRLQPDNVEAHIKKAELLLGKSDRSSLDETVAAATMTLAAVDLDRFKASIEKLGADTAQHVAEPEVLEQAEFGETVQDTVPLDESAADDLDFDLSDLDVPDIESDKQLHEQNEVDVSNADDDTEEMSWLHDAAFDGDLKQIDESGAAQQSDPVDMHTSTTQELDDILSEFPEHESKALSSDTPDTTESLDAAATDTLPDFDVLGGATQELDNLLTEFSDQDTVETVPDESQTNENFEDDRSFEEAGSTRHLDQLLSEFEDEDDISFADTQSGFDESVIERGKIEADDVALMPSESSGIDIDHEATQELDSLLAEFSDTDENQLVIGDESGELDESLFETAESASPQNDTGTIGMDTDHGATQELDNLLNEFSNVEEQTTDIDQTETDTVEHGATQVLGHLLEEFNDEDDDEENKKR